LTECLIKLIKLPTQTLLMLECVSSSFKRGN
jgi:hypothetical protein